MNVRTVTLGVPLADGSGLAEIEPAALFLTAYLTDFLCMITSRSSALPFRRAFPRWYTAPP